MGAVHAGENALGCWSDSRAQKMSPWFSQPNSRKKVPRRSEKKHTDSGLPFMHLRIFGGHLMN
jgi:hypothetical protein